VCRLLTVYIFMSRESTQEEEGNAASVEFSIDICFKVLKYFISLVDYLSPTNALILTLFNLKY
jgi:hypothetical protein